MPSKVPFLLCFVFALVHFILLLTFYLGASEKENIEAQLNQLKQVHTSELQQEKDEVTRLKEEIEGLKRRHEIEIFGVTESFKDELAKAKKDNEGQKTQAVNETIKSFETKIQRLNELTSTERRLNELQKQQVEALKAKMNDWRDVADRLNHEMEGELKSITDILCLF